MSNETHRAAAEAALTAINAAEERARRLVVQVKKTWSPPAFTGFESQADIAQTATMQTIAWVYGKKFLGELTANQEAAIDAALNMMHRELP